MRRLSRAGYPKVMPQKGIVIAARDFRGVQRARVHQYGGFNQRPTGFEHVASVDGLDHAELACRRRFCRTATWSCRVDRWRFLRPELDVAIKVDDSLRALLLDRVRSTTGIICQDGPRRPFCGPKLPMLRLRSVVPYAEAIPMDQKSAMPISAMATPPPSRCLSEIGLERRTGREREHMGPIATVARRKARRRSASHQSVSTVSRIVDGPFVAVPDWSLLTETPQRTTLEIRECL